MANQFIKLVENKMTQQELNAQQEDLMLEKALEDRREIRQEKIDRQKQDEGLSYCEFCKEWVEKTEKVKVDNGEKMDICEGCRDELYEFGEEEYNSEVEK
jgi:hypothetical protein